MTIEAALTALDTATAGCTLRELDAEHAAGTAVLVSPAGSALRLSPSVAVVIRALRAGDGHDAIAARFDAPPAAVVTALGQLAARIHDAFTAAAHRRPPGFLTHRKLVSGLRVARWVQPLTPLLAPWFAAIVVGASIAALAVLHAGVTTAASPPLALWQGYALGLVLMFVHELGHASACRHHGAPVGDIGCALYLIYPALFCDVSGTWALSRRARIVVDLAGVYFQLIATALAAVVWRWTGADALAAAVRLSTATMVLNLLPLGRLDGYWLLSDLLGVIDLRAQQRVVAAALWRRLRGRGVALPWSTGTTLAIVAYTVASAWFLVSILAGLFPRVMREAMLLGDRFGDLVTAVADGAGIPALLALGRLASSVVVGWIAVALTGQLARSAQRAMRRGRRRD